MFFEAIETDGTLNIRETPECQWLVTYENRLAAPSGELVYEHEGVVVEIHKGPGKEPELLVVHAHGVTYKLTVPDLETGYICVPFYLGA